MHRFHTQCGGFLFLGNLRNNSNAGLAYLNANNDLGNTNWNILTRLTSEIGYECDPHLSRAVKVTL